MAIQPPTYTNFLAYSSDEAAYWNNVVVADGTTKASCVPTALAGSIMTCTFSRTEQTGVREDLAMFSMHLSVATGANNAWAILTASDAALVEAAFDTWWTNVKTRFHPHWLFSGYIWRNFGASFPKGKTGLSKPGPVWRQTSRNVAGTSATPSMADQSAESVTLKTASRRHWGRFYVPPSDNGTLTVYSRLTGTIVDLLADSTDTFYGTLGGLSRVVHPFVWNSKNPGMFSVSQLQVDDVPDVIRRRRPKTKTYSKTHP
jgi:hypothetical protein